MAVKSKCQHVGAIWSPPYKEVEKVRCSFCEAPPGAECRGRHDTIPPHAIRYMDHHALTCGKGPDWTALQ